MDGNTTVEVLYKWKVVLLPLDIIRLCLHLQGLASQKVAVFTVLMICLQELVCNSHWGLEM